MQSPDGAIAPVKDVYFSNTPKTLAGQPSGSAPAVSALPNTIQRIFAQRGFPTELRDGQYYLKLGAESGIIGIHIPAALDAKREQFITLVQGIIGPTKHIVTGRFGAVLLYRREGRAERGCPIGPLNYLASGDGVPLTGVEFPDCDLGSSEADEIEPWGDRDIGRLYYEPHALCVELAVGRPEFFAKAMHNGYFPVPITPPTPDGLNHGNGKRPGYRDEGQIAGRPGQVVGLSDWTQYASKHPLPTQIYSWTEFECGIGICTSNVVAIDVDIPDEQLAADARAQMNWLPQSLERVGRAPKFLLLFRTNTTVAPQSFKWKARGVECGLDILGAGRQFVAKGIHPGTGKSYTWKDDRSPFNTPFADLPEITPDEIQRVIEALVPADIRSVCVAPSNTPRTISNNDHEPLTHEQLTAVLEALPNDDRTSWDDWNRVGMAIHTCGGGVDDFQAWSAKNVVKHDSKNTARKWKGFRTSRGEVGFGSLVDMLKKRGVAVPAEAVADSDVHVDLLEYWRKLAAKSSAPEVAAENGPFVDKHGRASKTVRSMLPLFSPPPLSVPFPQLRSEVSLPIHGAFPEALTFHAERALPDDPALAARIFQGIDRPRASSLRWLHFQETGSGKSTAFAAACEGFYATGRTDWNVVYVAKNGDMAEQFARELASRGVPFVNVRGVTKLCRNSELKPVIKAYSERGLSAKKICESCSLKSDCDYFKQQTGVSGKVLIYQIPHVALANLPGLGDGSAPVLLSMFDESILSEFVVTSRAPLSALAKGISVPRRKIRARATDDAYDLQTKQAEFERKAAELEGEINSIIRRVYAMVSSIDVHVADDAVRARAAVSMGALRENGFLSPALGYKSSAERDLIALQDALRAFQGAVLDQAEGQRKAGATINLKGRAGTYEKRLRHLINILTVIVENAQNRNENALGLIVEKHITKRRNSVTVCATRLTEMPEKIKDAPIGFCDATGDRFIIEAIMREHAPDQGKPASINAVEIYAPRWHIFQGRAERPFAKTIKVLDAPVAVSQLLRTERRGRPPLKKGETEIRGAVFTSGEKKRSTKPPALLLDQRRRSDASISKVERYLMHIRFSAPHTKIGVFAPKRLREAFEKRTWAKDVQFGHHGKGAGLNAWKDADILVVVGQLRPDAWAIEDVALAVALAHPTQPPVALWGRFSKREAPLTIAGKPFVLGGPGFVDLTCQRVLEQSQDAQSQQVYGRLRMSSRDASATCTLIAIDDVAGGEWDDAEVFAPPSAIELFRLTHGREPRSASEAASLEPELFGSVRSARRLLPPSRAQQSASNGASSASAAGRSGRPVPPGNGQGIVVSASAATPGPEVQLHGKMTGAVIAANRDQSSYSYKHLWPSVISSRSYEQTDIEWRIHPKSPLSKIGPVRLAAIITKQRGHVASIHAEVEAFGVEISRRRLAATVSKFLTAASQAQKETAAPSPEGTAA